MKAHQLHRKWDQPTSVIAADKIVPHLTRLQDKIELWAMSLGPFGFTDVDLNRNFGCTSSAYRSRRAELVAKGLIVDSGRRTKLDGAGRQAIVWIHADYKK